MQAILHSDYSCAPDGHTTRHYKAGDVLTGKAAQMALADGKAFDPVEETKPAPPLETKRGRKK
jgi:hypothetical protein